MKRILPITLWIFIFLASCADLEEFIDYTLQEPEIKLCLSGYVCPDSTYIMLSLNNYYLIDSVAWSHRANIIAGDNATVVLFEDGVFFDTLLPQSRQIWDSWEYVYTSEDYYVSHMPTTPGSTYTVYAQHGDYPEVSAETFLPVPVPIQSYDTEIIQYEQVTVVQVSLNIIDPLYENNYYFLPRSLRIPNVYGSFSLLTDPIFENHNVFGSTAYYAFFSDRLIQGSNYSVLYLSGLNLNETLPSDTFIFSLYSTSEDFFKYDKSRLIKENSQFDANSNPVTIYSNVVGGYGIFVGFSKSTIGVSFGE
jgi:hypothetical protein